MGVRRSEANHHYVGGYYGASSEEQMLRELVEDGPLVVSFEPQSDLMRRGRIRYDWLKDCGRKK